MAVPEFALVGQLDDSGAPTADRYAWQAAMAVVDTMALITTLWDDSTSSSASSVTVVCEYHEDYLLSWDGKVQLASVKHRDRGQPAWTIASFLDAGGLTHLFLSWVRLQRQCLTVLITTNPAQTGDPAKLCDLIARLRVDGSALTDSEQETIGTFAKALLIKIPDGMRESSWVANGAHTEAFAEVVFEFLRTLTIDCERSDRDELPFSALTRYVEPFLQRIGAPVSVSAEVWRQSTSMVAERMRDRGLGELGGLQAVADRFQPGGIEAIRRTLDSRTFTSDELLEIVEVCIALGLEPSVNTDAVPTTKLAAKLINGGCSPTTVQAAERHAELFREFEMKLVNADAPGSYADLASLRDWALLKAGYAQDATLADEHPGRAMWRSLPDVVQPPLELATVSVSTEVLIGAICALASECKVWFSEEFDVEAAIGALPMSLSVANGAP